MSKMISPFASVGFQLNLCAPPGPLDEKVERIRRYVRIALRVCQKLECSESLGRELRSKRWGLLHNPATGTLMVDKKKPFHVRFSENLPRYKRVDAV